jgi:hypothetical protein
MTDRLIDLATAAVQRVQAALAKGPVHQQQPAAEAVSASACSVCVAGCSYCSTGRGAWAYHNLLQQQQHTAAGAGLVSCSCNHPLCYTVCSLYCEAT